MTDAPVGDVERFNTAELGALLRERRGTLSLRQAAAEADVSFSTFSRVESGSQPDLVSFTKLCAWLGLPPSHFFAPVAVREVDTVESLVSHLRTDPRLSTENANKISNMLRDMYNALAQQMPAGPVVACHLRAASVLRPGVPDRLSSMLRDIETALTKRVESGAL